MIHEIQRNDFLQECENFASSNCLAISIAAGNDVEESKILEGWANLCSKLNGIGARIGYRSFMSILRDSEVDVRVVISEYFSQKESQASWRFVASPTKESIKVTALLQEIEWRANKAAHYQRQPQFEIIEID